MARFSDQQNSPDLGPDLDGDSALQSRNFSFGLQMARELADEDRAREINQQMLREQMQQLEPFEQQNMLSSPVQTAARGDQIMDAVRSLGRMMGAMNPQQQAVQAARAMFGNVPLEQAREFDRAVMEAQAQQARQAELTVALQAMNQNLDEFAAAQLAAEIAADEEASQAAMEAGRESALTSTPATIDYSHIDQMIADQLAAETAAEEEKSQAAMEAGRESELGTPAFSAPFSEESLTGKGFKDAWGNPADDWAEPALTDDEEQPPMSTPFGVALGTLGENVDVAPMTGQFGPMSQHQVAQLDEEDPWGENPFSRAEPAFSVPAMTTVAPNAFANAVAALAPPAAAPPNMPAVDDEQELGRAVTLEAQQPEPISMVSPRGRDMLSFSLEMQNANQAIANSKAERDKAEKLSRELETFGNQLEGTQLSGVPSARDLAADQMFGQNPFTGAVNALSTLGSIDPNNVMGLDLDPNNVISTPDIMGNLGFGEEEQESNPALDAQIAAQSMMAANPVADPFGTFSSAQLGFDPFSDPISSVASEPAAPAGAEDSSEDESEDTAVAPSMADLTGLSAAQDGPADPAPSDPAPSDAAPSDGGDSSTTGGDPSVGISGTDTSDPASGMWWKGGRVAKKAKPKKKSKGLAAMPYDD